MCPTWLAKSARPGPVTAQYRDHGTLLKCLPPLLLPFPPGLLRSAVALYFPNPTGPPLHLRNRAVSWGSVLK